MSRAYNATIKIQNYNKDNASDIVEALCDKVGIDEGPDFYSPNGDPPQMFFGQDINLYCGESEESFTIRVARTIFEANQGHCDITVGMTFLENLPYEEYNFTQKEYDLWKGDL